ncbi:hypothetical protein [Novosphingobium naphthalenivorans]|uniref:hypothetical protein n=1 Tax=Novosphingobium naphthalenivorans TaxID=273168 RepID=UPI00082C59A0|nr:hypothetical protein [Novosphingobium naphthalenivorans]
MSARDFVSKAIEGGADKRFRVKLEGPLIVPGELLSRALLELRGFVECYLECGCNLVDYTEDGIAPRQAPENRIVIESQSTLIGLIREIETYLGKPFIGPDWLDEIIAQGPDWAGGAA